MGRGACFVFSPLGRLRFRAGLLEISMAFATIGISLLEGFIAGPARCLRKSRCQLNRLIPPLPDAERNYYALNFVGICRCASLFTHALLRKIVYFEHMK